MSNETTEPRGDTGERGGTHGTHDPHAGETLTPLPGDDRTLGRDAPRAVGGPDGSGGAPGEPIAVEAPAGRVVVDGVVWAPAGGGPLLPVAERGEIDPAGEGGGRPTRRAALVVVALLAVVAFLLVRRRR